MRNSPSYKIGVVDADSIVYRVAASCEEESLEDAKDTLRGFIYESVYANTMCNKYIFCFSGGESGRSEIAKTKPYKGQRSTQKPNHFKDLFSYAIEEYSGLVLEDYEADDLVISIVDQIGWNNCILLGIDKDAKQLQGNHYNYVKKEHFYVSETEASINFYTQMLTGDTVDNIPGLPKIGVKKAEKLFSENPEIPPYIKVRELYEERGFDADYFLEQFQLLRMKKDIYYDYYPHMISFEKSKEEINKEVLLKEFE